MLKQQSTHNALHPVSPKNKLTALFAKHLVVTSGTVGHISCVYSQRMSTCYEHMEITGYHTGYHI